VGNIVSLLLGCMWWRFSAMYYQTVDHTPQVKKLGGL